MKRSCPNFSCSKYGKTCASCKDTGALCAPTCDDCKNKKTCKLPKDLNKEQEKQDKMNFVDVITWYEVLAEHIK